MQLFYAYISLLVCLINIKQTNKYCYERNEREFFLSPFLTLAKTTMLEEGGKPFE